MKNRNYLDVYLEKRKVGTLALLKDRRVAFEYSDEWIFDQSFVFALDKKSVCARLQSF